MKASKSRQVPRRLRPYAIMPAVAAMSEDGAPQGIARLEAFLERALEGRLTGLIAPGLEPVELAKRLERAMESDQRIGPGKVWAPNRYTVALHPDDFALFEDVLQGLARELAAHLQREARARRLSFASPPVVDLVSDPAGMRRQPLVRATFADLPAAEAMPSGATARMDFDLPRPAAVGQAPVLARLALGPDAPGTRTVAITRVPFSLGRGLDNDLPLEDSRVSRHHAQIVRQQHRLAVVDLNSTNGTRVNDQPVRECLLADGDRLSFGGVLVTLRLG